MAAEPRARSTRTRVPRSVDGRSYPEHLRQYEAFDDTLLPLLAELEPATYNALDNRITDPHMHADLPAWLNSAEWQGAGRDGGDDVAVDVAARSEGPAAPLARRLTFARVPRW